MRSLTFVVPGSLHTRTGGSIYDRRVVEGLRERGWEVSVVEVDPTAARGARLPPTGLVVVDGLIYSDILAGEAALDSSRGTSPVVNTARVLIPLIHLPLAETPGVTPQQAADRELAERRAIEHAAAVVVSGRDAAATLARYGVPSSKITIAEPGTDAAPLARGSGGELVELLCVATVNAGKGHDILLRALATIRQLPWHLSCAGSLDRDRATALAVQQLAAALDLGERIAWLGDLDPAALDARYAAADVFVLATRHETYGMAVAEALARGLPVVTTRTGAAPDLVGSTAGVLVPIGDPGPLGRAIASLISDRDLRMRCAEGARCVRAMLPPWTRTVDLVERVLTELQTRGDVSV